MFISAEKRCILALEPVERHLLLMQASNSHSGSCTVDIGFLQRLVASLNKKKKEKGYSTKLFSKLWWSWLLPSKKHIPFGIVKGTLKTINIIMSCCWKHSVKTQTICSHAQSMAVIPQRMAREQCRTCGWGRVCSTKRRKRGWKSARACVCVFVSE